MVGLDPTADMPITARYHREAIEEIVHCVEEHIYSALLGPRLCGKTLMLRYIEAQLAPLLGWTCVYINLEDLRATTQQAFFADLIHLTAQRLTEASGQELFVSVEETASSADFRALLSESLESLERDVVMIIDPLEAIPTDLVQALLTSLRAAYMDQQTLDHQLTVVVSGALSLATLAVGESSPFRGIARRVFVGDLSNQESLNLILDLLAEQGVSATPQALNKLLQATKGDVYLIRKISQCCADLALSRSNPQIRSRDVSFITDRFLRDEVLEYAPLIEAIRLIEDDPDLLQCILILLEQDDVPRSVLPLPLSPDLDPLYLTGVVEAVEKPDGDYYCLQNLIYTRFLAQHFTPGRVGHVLAMAGRWDSAIDYLEASVQQDNRQSRSDLLTATINSIYAAQDLAQAVHFLRRGLSAAFGVREAQIWYSPPQENFLRLISPAYTNLNGELPSNLQIPNSADRLEARAYRQRVTLRGHEGDQRLNRAIPLNIPGQKPFGVVTLLEEFAHDLFLESRERDLLLVGFLNQAARALQTVSIRRQELALAGRVQASLLPVEPPQPRGWQIAAVWRPARETAGDFYDFISLPAGKIAIVMADVVDKGMGAALLMALSRTLIRSYAADYPDEPERLLHVVNQRIIADINSGLFVTLFYGVLDPSSGTLTYCNGGHPPPKMLAPGDNGVLVEGLFRTGIPLGISDDAVWERAIVQVPPGGLLLLYTDGVTDIQNQEGQFFGEKGMLEVVSANTGHSAHQAQDALLSSIYTFAGAEPQVDDITLMVLKRGPARKANKKR
jgi:hypothetical protein